MADEFDYYAFLGVPHEADEATIRMAYRTLARRYHPDIAGDDSLNRMRQLNIAYRTLSDPERRRAYDEQHPAPAGQRPASTPSAATGQSATRPAPMPFATTTRADIASATAGPFSRVATLDSATSMPVGALCFTADGGRLGLGLIDGAIQLWDTSAPRPLTTLSFAATAGAGVLHELRLSPQGAYAAAWGFRLGMRVWRVADGCAVWNTAINAPGGMLDLALADEPPLARLALPDAPLALADEDAFRWAHEGRRATSVLSRPLGRPVDPAWAVPLQCVETVQRGFFGGETLDDRWRIHQRVLSTDGRLLLTFSTGKAPQYPTARVLHLWQLDHPTPGRPAQARRVAQIAEPLEYAGFPLATTPDLAWAACSHLGQTMRLWSIRDGKHATIPTGEIGDDAIAALSPDARYLALARGPRLDLWETATARAVQQWRFSADITTLALARTPGAERPILAAGLRNGLADLWS